jgi:AraC-like DNA-binding protein
MERARELLVHSGERISSVAHLVGFPDEAYFTRRFRQRFGTSPSAYRQAAQAGGAATPRPGRSRARATPPP